MPCFDSEHSYEQANQRNEHEAELQQRADKLAAELCAARELIILMDQFLTPSAREGMTTQAPYAAARLAHVYHEQRRHRVVDLARLKKLVSTTVVEVHQHLGLAEVTARLRLLREAADLVGDADANTTNTEVLTAQLDRLLQPTLTAIKEAKIKARAGKGRT